jgi:hypothetical protein
VDQTSATTPPSATADAQGESQSISPDASTAAPGFGARGRVRRRARFLRRARELAYRDLGGLVFNLHRFGQRNDTLVLAKLSTLGHIDSELRALESALAERQPVTVLREAGITACPRCAAIHSSEDRFCPNCGLPLSRRVDLPIAGAAAAAPPTPAANPPSSPGAPPATAPGPVTGPTPAPAAVEKASAAHAAPATPAVPGAAPSPTPDPLRSAAPPATRPAPTTQAFPAQAPATQQFPAQTPEQATDSDDEPTEIVRPPAAGK